MFPEPCSAYTALELARKQNQKQEYGLNIVKTRKLLYGQMLVTIVAAYISFQSTGCSVMDTACENIMYNQGVDRMMVGTRNKIWARRAFNECRGDLNCGSHESSFRDGFIDGYQSVCDGGSGCAPAMPPRDYWSWQNNSSQGRAKSNAWYEGYPKGVRAAQSQGMGSINQIQVADYITPDYSGNGLPPVVNGNLPLAPQPAPTSNLTPTGTAPRANGADRKSDSDSSDSGSDRPAGDSTTRLHRSTFGLPPIIESHSSTSATRLMISPQSSATQTESPAPTPTPATKPKPIALNTTMPNTTATKTAVPTPAIRSQEKTIARTAMPLPTSQAKHSTQTTRIQSQLPLTATASHAQASYNAPLPVQENRGYQMHENQMHENQVHENQMHENQVHENQVHESAMSSFANAQTAANASATPAPAQKTEKKPLFKFFGRK